MQGPIAKLSIFASVVAVTFAFAEILVRLAGHDPWRIQTTDLREPTMSEFDPTLGWITKPGKYTVPPYQAKGEEIHYTFLPDGSRIASKAKPAGPYDIVLLGGSFTQGRAISDWETVGWKLQSALPDSNVGIFAVGAYGTYQSFLMLKRLYQRGIRPKVVLYGFADFHEYRNIAHYEWRRLLSQYSKRGHIAMPYCSLGKDGRLREHPPAAYPVLPLREHFALVDFLTMTYYQFSQDERERERQRAKITNLILLKMNRLARDNAAAFYVAVLYAKDSSSRFYTRTLRSKNVSVIDARIRLTPEMAVPGEGHPNGRAHSRWATKIESRLREDAGPRM
jgi:hypothetical protein